MADDKNRLAGPSWMITLGLSTLLGLTFGWRVGVGVVAAIVLYGGLIQFQAEMRK